MQKKISFKVTTEENGTETERTIHAGFADLARYDIIRNRLGFPGQEEAPILFMGLLAFCNLVRTGQIPANTKVETFLDSIASVEELESEVSDADSKSGGAE